MDEGLLSLKWNNHRTTFFHILRGIRSKNSYNDVTLACDGNFYPAHKIVLSTCSDYFEQMFEQTQCKHPVIVLKDIKKEEIESLLDYMYIGEVNVVQDKLSGLIKAAECLRIKGLAVPDEEPVGSKPSSRDKRTNDNSVSSEAKRRKPEQSSSSYKQNSVNRSEEKRKSIDSNKFRSNNVGNNSSCSTSSDGTRRDSDHLRLSAGVSHHISGSKIKTEKSEESSDQVVFDEPSDSVKQEPVDLDAVYLSDSNSATDTKGLLVNDYGDDQQHFMDEILGQNSAPNQGQMGEFIDTGDGSGTSGTSGQQHLVFADPPDEILNTWTIPATVSSMNFGASKQIQLPSAISSTSNSSMKPMDKNNAVPFDEMFQQLIPNSQGMKYTCPVCERKAVDKCNLRSHYRTHTGEKPFGCPHCSYRSTQVSSIKPHIRRRHPDAISI